MLFGDFHLFIASLYFCLCFDDVFNLCCSQKRNLVRHMKIHTGIKVQNITLYFALFIDNVKISFFFLFYYLLALGLILHLYDFFILFHVICMKEILFVLQVFTCLFINILTNELVTTGCVTLYIHNPLSSFILNL